MRKEADGVCWEKLDNFYRPRADELLVQPVSSGETVRAYPRLARLIDDRYRYPDVEQIKDGCLVCGAKNPPMVKECKSFDLECEAWARATIKKAFATEPAPSKGRL